MPFQSEAQRGFMYAKHPKIAKRFEEETPADAKLPAHVKKMNQGGFPEDWKNDLAGYMDQHFGPKRDEPQNMARGGMAGDFDPLEGLLPPAAPLPAFDPMSGRPPPALPLAAPVPARTPAPIAPVAPPVAPRDDTAMREYENYLTQQRQQLNAGAGEQEALEQSIQKQRTGLIPNIANAGAGLADAIMQGVARAGPSNFQSSLQSRQDKTQEGMRQALERTQSGRMSRMKQEMELAQIDPQSPLSRMAQRSAAPLFKAMGVSEDEMRNMPASLIGEAQTRRLSLEEIRVKADEARALREQNALLRGEELGLRREGAEAEKQKEKTARAEKVTERQYEGAKDMLSRAKKKKEWHGIPLPWTSEVPKQDYETAANMVRQRMAGQPFQAPPPQVNSREEWEALPPGTPYTDSNGVPGIKQ